MSPIRSLAALGATAALTTPAALALAAEPVAEVAPPRPGALTASPTGHPTIRAAMRAAEHAARHRRALRGYRDTARRTGHHPRAGARHWDAARLRRAARRLRRRAAERAARRAAERAAAARPTGALAAIAQCESGGDPQAIGGGGTYRGLYQFTYATWASVGGSGDPAAASVAEQTRRAQMLYARSGPGQWPVCGR